MKKINRPGLLAAVLVVLVAGAFIGIATAHDGGGDQVHDDCEMTHGEAECPMMDGGMMGGGMMQMGDDCPMNDGNRMMDRHGNCPMR